MIRVHVEVWPGGDERGRYTIAHADIWRTEGQAPDATEFEYDYNLYRGGDAAPRCPIADSAGFPGNPVNHRYVDDVWSLLRRVLDDAAPRRPGDE